MKRMTSQNIQCEGLQYNTESECAAATVQNQRENINSCDGEWQDASKDEKKHDEKDDEDSKEVDREVKEKNRAMKGRFRQNDIPKDAIQQQKNQNNDDSLAEAQMIQATEDGDIFAEALFHTGNDISLVLHNTLSPMDTDEPVKENEFNKYYQTASDSQNNIVPSDNVGEISSASVTTMTTNSNTNVSHCRENSVESSIDTFTNFEGNFSEKAFMPLSKDYMVTSNLKEIKLPDIMNNNSLPSINTSNVSIFLRRKNSLIKDLNIKPIISKQTPLVTFEQDDVYIPAKDDCQQKMTDFSSRSQPYIGDFDNVPSVLTNIAQRNCTDYALISYNSNNSIFLSQGRQMNISSSKRNKFSVNFQRSLSTLSFGSVASINYSNCNPTVNKKKFENLISNLNLSGVNQSNFKTSVMISRTGQNNISQMELASSPMTSFTLYVNSRNPTIHEKYLHAIFCPISNDSLIRTSLTDHSSPLNPCAENYFSSKKFLTISKANTYKLPFIHSKKLNSVDDQLERNNFSELPGSLSLRLVSNSSNVNVQDSISVSMIRNLKISKRSNSILLKRSVRMVMLPSNASENTSLFSITPSWVEQLISCKEKPCLLQTLAENIFDDCYTNLVCLDKILPVNRSNFPRYLPQTTYDSFEGNQRCLSVRFDIFQSLLKSMMLFHINPQYSDNFPEYGGTININQIWKQVKIDFDRYIVLIKLINNIVVNTKNTISSSSQACITYPSRKSITSLSDQNFESSNICIFLKEMEQNCQNILANIKQLLTSCNSEVIIKTNAETITLPVNHALVLIDSDVQSILGFLENSIKTLSDEDLNSQKVINTKKLLPFQYRNLFQITVAQQSPHSFQCLPQILFTKIDDRSSDNKLIPNVSRDISLHEILNSLILHTHNHKRRTKQFGLKYTNISSPTSRVINVYTQPLISETSLKYITTGKYLGRFPYKLTTIWYFCNSSYDYFHTLSNIYHIYRCQILQSSGSRIQHSGEISQDVAFCGQLMPRADDNFTLQFVSTKLFQDLLFKNFLSLLTRKYLEDLFPWIFNPKIYILPRSWLLSSMSHRSEICNLFQRCLLTAEDSIRCLRWDDLVSNPPATLPGDPEQPLIHRGVEEDEANLADTDKLMNFDGSLSLLDEMALGEGESLSTPSSPHSISSYSRRQINLPKGLKDLDYKILQSGIFIFPGSYALDHSLVGFLFTSSPLWRDQMISSSELARHFLYFSTLSRKRKKCVGLTLVADIRGSTSSTVNTILEALHLFHSNNEQGFRSIYILANQLDQTLIFGSPLYDAQGPLKIEVLQSPDVLQSYIGVDQLPSAFDGQLEYHHDSWLRFRRKLEPFVNDCQLVDQYLQDTLKQLTIYDRIPSTYDETSQFLWEHEQQMQSILDAPQLMLLQDGHSIIHQLQEEAPYLKSIESCKEELVSVKKMYKELQNSMKNLVKLAENRFHKLEQGLQLRGFESECNKLNVWISTEGKRILEKYNSCVDNLKSAKSLEEQFLKDYFSAMTYIDKGNDLVEEACMLAQSGISTDSATGYRDLVKGLKVHLKQFIKDLEATREKVEGTRKIYRTLDKAYNWALESMKFIVNMKTENCSSVEKLDNMIRSMELFMQDHPPISDELFKETLQQAKELQNEKLISQCQKTIARCEEAQCKLKSRKLALKRAKSQRQTKSLANSDSPCNCIVKSSVTDLDENYLLLPPSQSEKKTASWHAICASLPTSPKIQPRRASLPTKGEIVTQISPISNMSSQDMEEYQEQLFNDGYITEDLSHHVVTSLPKSLTLRPDPNDCDTSGNKDKLFSRLYSSKKSITRTVTVPVTLSHSVPSYKLTSSQTLPQVDTPGTLDSVPRTVALILQELISTERDYVQALKLIVDNYIPEITKEEVPHALRGKRNIIFGNIEKIYEFHNQYFLQELETCKHYPFQIAQIFLSHEEQFYLYALYNKNKPKSDHLMAEHGTEFFRIKQNELKDKMNLSSYLLRPVQRMGKYALLLKQMIKACPETETEYNDLKSAEEMVKFHLRHGNDMLAMDSLKECDVNLQEQGRLLRQNEFFVTQGRKKSMRHIFLFEELVLFSKTKKDRHGGPESYIYKYSFKTSDIGLTENFRDHTNKFEIWFRRRSLGENYILHAQDNDIKKSWVQDISRLLWRQAIKNRESRKTEMASMGMGSKPSFDLKGDYNLNENLVASGQFAARSRNSIAVSSVDHFRDGAKRPLSINSLSSTSSSSSGQSTSHGLLNSLNLAFENMIVSSNANADSPHFNRRSMNSSNESGICTDIFPETEGCVATAANAQTGSTSATTLPVNTRMLASSTNSSPCPYQQTNSDGTSMTTTTTSIQTPTQPTSTAANKHALSDQPSSIDTQVSSAITFTPPSSTTTKQADPARLWLDLSKTRQPNEFKLRLAPMHGLTQTNIANIHAEESEL
ncbi:uncharacterized protein LOC106870865 isoform X3 [Octopus bimaculoides]|nr:uncharacterized protein LOC106870865 isoform X3 [Octopus bimaculoides]